VGVVVVGVPLGAPVVGTMDGRNVGVFVGVVLGEPVLGDRLGTDVGINVFKQIPSDVPGA